MLADGLAIDVTVGCSSSIVRLRAGGPRISLGRTPPVCLLNVR